MNVCIIGEGLTALSLAKSLINKKINVHYYHKSRNSNFSSNRTIGISKSNFEFFKEKIFLKSWQWIGDKNLVSKQQSVYPFVLLDGFLTEPLLLTKDKEGMINCLTNVCTHRGNLVALESGHSKKLTCSYHGRRFNLQGKFEFMPEFNDAENFPRPCDNLHTFPIKKWGHFLFAGLNPSFDFQEVINVFYEKIKCRIR